MTNPEEHDQKRKQGGGPLIHNLTRSIKPFLNYMIISKHNTRLRFLLPFVIRCLISRGSTIGLRRRGYICRKARISELLIHHLLPHLKLLHPLLIFHLLPHLLSLQLLYNPVLLLKLSLILLIIRKRGDPLQMDPKNAKRYEESH
jgi:hypothetical protein